MSSITVYSNKKIVRTLSEIINYYNIWMNYKEFTEVSEKKWIFISLKKKWENMIANMKLKKIYFLDVDKQKNVNKIFNKLHEQSCINWSINHSSNEYLMFMTWRNVEHNEKMIRKARIVVNMHNLNKLIISDIYSMSLQSEIIVMIADKNYISVVDVTAFFYH